MPYENRLLDDLARVAGGAVGAVAGIRDEVENRLRAELERVVLGMNLVGREEFEAVREMAAKARAENEVLRARIEQLEARLAAPSPP